MRWDNKKQDREGGGNRNMGRGLQEEPARYRARSKVSRFLAIVARESLERENMYPWSRRDGVNH